jgi:hypothetical protein
MTLAVYRRFSAATRLTKGGRQRKAQLEEDQSMIDFSVVTSLYQPPPNLTDNNTPFIG